MPDNSQVPTLWCEENLGVWNNRSEVRLMTGDDYINMSLLCSWRTSYVKGLHNIWKGPLNRQHISHSLSSGSKFMRIQHITGVKHKAQLKGSDPTCQTPPGLFGAGGTRGWWAEGDRWQVMCCPRNCRGLVLFLAGRLLCRKDLMRVFLSCLFPPDW